MKWILPFFIIVGTLNNDPYEIFAGVNVNSEGDIIIPKNFKEAIIEKEKRGKYSLIEIENNKKKLEEQESSKDNTDKHIPDEEASLFAVLKRVKQKNTSTSILYSKWRQILLS